MNPTPQVDAWHDATLGEAAVKVLKKNGFDAVFAATPEEAVEKVMAFIAKGKTVGFGGSMTVKALGIQEKAKELGAEILDHNAQGLSPDGKLAVLRRQLTCDVFVSGSNAVTLEGDIVNVDGNGNRVAALTFGPAKTVVVVGVNKIVRDLDEAMARIESYASPMNNKRLDKTNPCVKTGLCEDCEGATRICRVYQILRRKPSLSDFTVVIVGARLGY
ncbi:MAG TPA: lactate utilization protein [Spirochaetales bacterium]|nr:lactate utilization protein [Spirochaetales bacterium]